MQCVVHVLIAMCNVGERDCTMSCIVYVSCACSYYTCACYNWTTTATENKPERSSLQFTGIYTCQVLFEETSVTEVQCTLGYNYYHHTRMPQCIHYDYANA